MLLFRLPKRSPLFAAHRCFFATAIQNPDPEPSKSPNFIVVDYLVASFGFSPEKAVRVSKSIAHLKSPQNPDALRCFLQYHGFTDADIKAFIPLLPKILCASVDKNIAPNLRALSEMGLSTSALTSILLSNPAAIFRVSAVSKIKFWRDFLGGDEEALVRAFKINKGLITYDIDTNIQPKISFLQRHGLSNHDIGWILVRSSSFITSSFSTIEDALNRAKEMGFDPESGMFLAALHAMKCVSRDMIQKKMDLLKGFGWSQDDLFSALRKYPLWDTLSEKNLKVTMDFLMEVARCDPSYVASYPALLTYSIEKRLRPRQDVLCILESKGLSGKVKNYYSFMNMTDSMFVGRYILPNKDISGLYESYFAACGRDSTPSKNIEVRDSILDTNGEY